jgi:hypothetical protein
MSDVVGTITWAELGCPKEPGTVDVRGMSLKIEDRHIKAAEGERHVTFKVLGVRLQSGPDQYKLGIRVD